MKWWAWLLIAVILLLIIGAIYKSQTSESGLAVEYALVQKRDIIETVSASGKIFPETEVKISSDVSGQIVELNVAEGDSVKKGEILARIDPDAYLSQVRRGKAALNTARVQLAQSKSAVQVAIAQKLQAEARYKNQKHVHQRNVELHKKGVISDLDFENSLMSLETAEADFKAAQATLKSRKKDVIAAQYNIESAEASLSELETSLNRTTIQAPMDGVVSLLNVERGERVVGTIQMSGTVLMRIADLSSIEAQVEVSENDILNVSLGDKVTIEIDAYYGRTFTGHVTEIANSAANIATTSSALTSDQVTNFIVKVRIDRDSYDDLLQAGKVFPFRPGMSCSVDIQTQEAHDVLAVPLAAVTTREKYKDSQDSLKNRENEIVEVVFTVQNDTARRTIVSTGIQDRAFIQVLSGLSEGETLISGPYSAVSKKLEDGSKVYEKEKK